jgi:hypothetical protein
MRPQAADGRQLVSSHWTSSQELLRTSVAAVVAVAVVIVDTNVKFRVVVIQGNNSIAKGRGFRPFADASQAVMTSQYRKRLNQFRDSTSPGARDNAGGGWATSVLPRVVPEGWPCRQVLGL